MGRDIKLSKSNGPGWERIVFPLMAYCDAYGITVLQIKEKFGGLMFYYRAHKDRFMGGDPRLDNLVDAAYQESINTCEWCGRRGTRTRNGWIKTLCPEHTLAWAEGKRWWDGTNV